MMLGSHIEKEGDEILFGYICPKKIIVSVLLLLITLEIVCHIVAVKCAILYVPTEFLQISLTSYFNLANNFKPNNLGDRIYRLALFALAPYQMNITFLQKRLLCSTHLPGVCTQNMFNI